MNNLKFILLLILLFLSNSFSQRRPLDLAIIGEPLKDFTLPVYNGGDFTLAEERGKNLLLIFLRGYYDKDIWCDICAYEYLDLVDEFSNKHLAEKYNLDLVFILPYDTVTIRKWLDDLPEVYAGLEAGKHLADTLTNEKSMTWVHFANKHYPKTFTMKDGETPQPFRILSDEDHQVSERLDIFRTEWWGTKVEQNLPTFILLDTEGTVIFKYISQHTIDRPTSFYLQRILDALIL
ncbi:MAG: peroxiredoxin family protein [Ignavibacteriaceae bacterium]|nr:peroxiredoxin family protein [Ignavibacteriaceae bacterium]